ncbi:MULTISPECIES: DUF2982 domain-containing protein [unclassified Alteromonas]|uniref:DUF2982 domain-containing protein n=1 Tax=unclassified Alteromonas TaxID=2614992 RepID=UPI001922010C|nr:MULTISPECIES: DUF2982 domain-containing protein [unclassified Alteromonas]WDT86495.1 DUF2982 domain-containing protein [Alteromonas sp. 009811495]BCO17493.1 hypothetical protein KUC3_03500 [Alteromonas sp. KC3]BCO21471.1 hypothetical protein KUC14_03400 [Alteromonas sp. KC14]
MSGNSEASIYIKAASKGNGITSLVIGAVGLVIAALWLSFMPDWLFLAGIFITSAALVCLLVGYFKLREPDYSLEIAKDYITYQHRLGSWRIHWDNLQRADCPRVRHGLEHVPLETVGFKLKSYTDFLHTISPRLATHLLMEQRPLLMQNTDENCASGSCYEQSMFDDKQYVMEDGTVINGIKAMLAHRMVELRKRLGFDIFIASSELDRDAQDFARLIASCQQARQQD